MCRMKPAGGWRNFITGAEGLGSDGWRIDYLELLAIAAKDDAAIVGEPRAVLDIANRYAATGVPLVLDWLESGQSDPIDNILDRLRERIRRPISRRRQKLMPLRANSGLS